MQLNQAAMCRGNEKAYIEDFGRSGANAVKLLLCSQCPSTFKSHSLLRRHLIRSHEEVLLHGCTDCLQMFTNLLELQEHRRTAHINGCGKPVKCPECPKTFSTEKNMRAHRRSHREWELLPCPLCPMKFSAQRYLESHLASHSNVRPFQCHLCQKTFKYKRTLNSHIKTHSGLKPHECLTCGCRYHDRSSLRRHLNSHSRAGGKSYNCDVCRKKFANLYELSSHLQTHISSPVFSPNYVYDYSNIYEPNSIDESPKKSASLYEVTDIKAKLFVPGDLLKKSFDCAECPETFIRRSDWLRHFRTHRGSKPYRCTECGQTFLESGDLRNHLLDHSKDMYDAPSDNSNDSCFTMSDEVESDYSANDSMGDSIPMTNPKKSLDELSDQISVDIAEETNDESDGCYSDFTDNFRDDLSDGGFSELSLTLRQLHYRKNSRPHKCPMCRLRFRQINHLLTHLDTHLPNRPYKCNKCNLSFKRPDTLRRHELTHIPREKPFKCSLCPEMFVSANYLGRHMRVHGGSKPYSCSHCDFTFKSPSSLEKHMKVHEAKTKSVEISEGASKERTYKCAECLCKFRKKKTLMRHLFDHLGR